MNNYFFHNERLKFIMLAFVFSIVVAFVMSCFFRGKQSFYQSFERPSSDREISWKERKRNWQRIKHHYKNSN